MEREINGQINKIKTRPIRTQENVNKNLMVLIEQHILDTNAGKQLS